MENKSEFGDLNKEDMKKIAKGFFIAVAGAGLTYAEQMVSSLNFGEWTPVVVAVNCALVNILRKFLNH